MAKHVQIGTRKAARTVARKAMAGRSSSVMKPEYIELIENFRLMDDTFMSKCLENAPECIELMLRIINSTYSQEIPRTENTTSKSSARIAEPSRDVHGTIRH